MRTSRIVVLVFGLVVLAAAGCGSDAAPEGTVTAADIQESEGAGENGSFTIAIGDQSWTFDAPQCAFGEDEIGREGAEFELSVADDGLQATMTVDAFGPDVRIFDVEDPENPSVSWSSVGTTAAVDIAGKNLSGLADFVDGTIDDATPTSGTFAGTCP